MAEIEHGTVPVSSTPSMTQKITKLTSKLLPNSFDSGHAPQRRDLLFVVAGRTQADTPVGRKNWLTDYFAEDFAEDSVVVQYRELARRLPRAHRPAFTSTYSFHDSGMREDIRSRFAPPSEKKVRATRAVVAALYAELDFAVSAVGISVATNKVLRHQARVEGMRQRYDSLLTRVSPKIVIMDGASYGGSRAIQVRAAKERGIPVAELQHGWIGAAHGAYNFGRSMWRDEMRQYLPDVLLTFGDYWAEEISSPFTAVSIGKPHLEAMVATAPPCPALAGPHDVQPS
jgi:hypothetical protein